mmetsp:Transcript_11625/g.21801  ORF Transcript_11625/g.21801 Transcript_11625/m.21801 type:complete len:159 (-) Transcript_11625:43-519(-)
MRNVREDVQERPDDAVFRIGTALTSSIVAGAALGAVKATWSNIKITKAGGRSSALLQVVKVMGDYAATFGSAGAAFAAGDVIAESFRDRKDIFNGAFGGLAGGLVLGIRAGKISFGLGAAAALAAASMGVEVSGGRMRGPSGFGDGAVPNKKFIGEEI